MGNKNSSEFRLSLLLITAFCSEAFSITSFIISPGKKKSWTEARQYCQENYIDLITWDIVQHFDLTDFLLKKKVQEIWIGLMRDPKNDSAWRGIDVISGEGIAGDDYSQDRNWEDGHQSSHCAFVSGADLKWYTAKCLKESAFYCSQNNKIKHFSILRNWYKASQYCQDRTSNLSTITGTNDLQDGGWIGLYREGGDTWKWIGGPSDYRNWAPQGRITYDCASFDHTTKKWHSKVCSEELHFVCYGDNLLVVNENKTWEEALKHCMETPCVGRSICKYELLSLESLSDYDYNYVRERIFRATTDEVWTSLRFQGGKWFWVNGKELADHGMLPDCPSLWKHCGTLSKHDTNKWIIRDCSERRNFICQAISKRHE